MTRPDGDSLFLRFADDVAHLRVGQLEARLAEVGGVGVPASTMAAYDLRQPPGVHSKRFSNAESNCRSASRRTNPNRE
jgi:hypothetical protein